MTHESVVEFDRLVVLFSIFFKEHACAGFGFFEASTSLLMYNTRPLHSILLLSLSSIYVDATFNFSPYQSLPLLSCFVLRLSTLQCNRIILFLQRQNSTIICFLCFSITKH